jgi:hypothetical protein
VTFHRDPQEAGFALRNPCHVALSIPDPAHNVVRQIHKKSTRRSEMQGVAFSLKELDSVVFLNGPHVVRDSGLRKIQTLSRLGEISRLGQGYQGSEMAQFEHGFINSMNDVDKNNEF